MRTHSSVKHTTGWSVGNKQQLIIIVQHCVAIILTVNSVDYIILKLLHIVNQMMHWLLNRMMGIFFLFAFLFNNCQIKWPWLMTIHLMLTARQDLPIKIINVDWFLAMIVAYQPLTWRILMTRPLTYQIDKAIINSRFFCIQCAIGNRFKHFY